MDHIWQQYSKNRRMFIYKRYELLYMPNKIIKWKEQVSPFLSVGLISINGEF